MGWRNWILFKVDSCRGWGSSPLGVLTHCVVIPIVSCPWEQIGNAGSKIGSRGFLSKESFNVKHMTWLMFFEEHLVHWTISRQWFISYNKPHGRQRLGATARLWQSELKCYDQQWLHLYCILFIKPKFILFHNVFNLEKTSCITMKKRSAF